jgi:Family of unknown function (DUF5908)
MPVIINEIQITTVVGDTSANAAPEEGTSVPAAAGNAGDAIDRRQIVAECIEEVMRILKEKQER